MIQEEIHLLEKHAGIQQRPYHRGLGVRVQQFPTRGGSFVGTLEWTAGGEEYSRTVLKCAKTKRAPPHPVSSLCIHLAALFTYLGFTACCSPHLLL